MKKLKRNSIYGAILSLPLITYILASATILNLKVDYEIYTAFENVEIVEREEELFFYTTDNAEMSGVISYDIELERYGIIALEDEIVKIERRYYTFAENEEGVIGIKKMNPFQAQKQEKWKIPVGVAVSAFSIIVVVLVILGKLRKEIMAKNIKLSILIALAIGTGILGVISLIAQSMFTVFGIATGSFAVYMGVEKWFDISDKRVKKIVEKSETVKMLDDIIQTL